MTRIHAICLVKNEGDVIAQTLHHASQFCHKIYVFDTGSTDDSWKQVQLINNSVVVPFRQEKVSYSEGLRAQVFNTVRKYCATGDWFLNLDADEFLAENPQKAIKIAEQEEATQINTLQYNFYFTDKDCEDYRKGHDSRSRPIAQRRRYYRFVNIEQRLFRVREDLTWPEHNDTKHPSGYQIPVGVKKHKKCSYKIPNCHYQYRDPEQIKLRLETRRTARMANQSSFLHYKSLDEGIDWTQSIVPSELLHYYHNDGKFKFTVRERAKIFRETLGSRSFFRFDFMAT
jgi:glycosyltransferase involved in cell wall biosynthesis